MQREISRNLTGLGVSSDQQEASRGRQRSATWCAVIIAGKFFPTLGNSLINAKRLRRVSAEQSEISSWLNGGWLQHLLYVYSCKVKNCIGVYYSDFEGRKKISEQLLFHF